MTFDLNLSFYNWGRCACAHTNWGRCACTHFHINTHQHGGACDLMAMDNLRGFDVTGWILFVFCWDCRAPGEFISAPRLSVEPLDYDGCHCTSQHVGSEDANRPPSFLLHGAVSLDTQLVFNFILWCYHDVSTCVWACAGHTNLHEVTPTWYPPNIWAALTVARCTFQFCVCDWTYNAWLFMSGLFYLTQGPWLHPFVGGDRFSFLLVSKSSPLCR